MEKKTIYYIIGGVALLGIGYFLWNKSKKSSEEKESTDDNLKSDELTQNKVAKKSSNKSILNSSTLTTLNPSSIVVKKLTPQELESKLSSGCGKKPKLKKNKTLWNNCRNDMKDDLKNQGLIAFDGSYSFEGSNDFYSRFDSNFDLNM